MKLPYWLIRDDSPAVHPSSSLSEMWQEHEWKFSLLKDGAPSWDPNHVMYYHDIEAFVLQEVYVVGRPLTEDGYPTFAVDFTFGFATSAMVQSYALTMDTTNQVLVIVPFDRLTPVGVGDQLQVPLAGKPAFPITVS